MKNALCLFALLLGLAACTSAVPTPTSTVTRLPTFTKTPTPPSTDTPSPTNTQLPTASPRLEASPTPTETAIIFTHGLAPSPDQAIFVPKDQMKDVVAKVLDSQLVR